MEFRANKFWRYDSGLHTISEAEFCYDVPLNEWLPKMYGEGDVIYSLTKLESLQHKTAELVDQISRLQKLLNEVETEIKEITWKNGQKGE